MSVTTAVEGPEISAQSRPRYLIARLSLQIFLAFAAMGAWLPVFSYHLKNLHFSASATAWASATSALSSLVAPLIWGQIADRWLPMQRCISLCALVSAGGLSLLAQLNEPWSVFAVCLGTWLFLIPAIGLTSSLIFRQLEHPERDYGKVRIWGTLGWILINWCLTLWFALERWQSGRDETALVDYSASLYLGAIAALVLACYAWTLPHTPPSRATESAGASASWLRRVADAPLGALRLFRDRSFAVYCVCMFGMYITMPFTAQLNPLLLADLEVDARILPVYLTIAQSTEVLLLLVLPMLLFRLGAKTTMLMGGAVWTVGLLTLSLPLPIWVILPSLTSHGIFICCFLIAGQVFVNRQATHDIRASAQGILLFIAGSGLLVGHLLVGYLREWTGDQYAQAYLAGAGIAGVMTLLFLGGFEGSTPGPISSEETLVPDPEIT